MVAGVRAHRPPKPPIVLDRVLDDGELVRRLAPDNGPYWQPGRNHCRAAQLAKVIGTAVTSWRSPPPDRL